MSSRSVKQPHEEVKESKVKIEKSLDIHNVVIPFAQLKGFSHTEYIYTGQEKIPFRERHPVYQMLLKHEFANL